MQNEIIVSQKQTKTLTRVTLALCLLCMLSFTGCSTTCPDWCGNRTYTRNKPWAGPGDGQNVPGKNPSASHMPGGHPPYSTWVVMKKDVGSDPQPIPGSQSPPRFKIIANWYPEYPSSHPKEMYLLLERGGVYTMNYWHDPKQDHTGNYWLHPVTVDSLKPITAYMDLNKESRLTITLIDPNTEPEQISPFRPNGDFWKTNSYGNLEIWYSDGVVETIPNLKLYLNSKESGDGQNHRGGGVNLSDLDLEDLPEFPGKDVIDGLDAVGGPGGIPIREECPNWFCPRKSSGVRVSGGTGYVISSDGSGYVISEP